MIFSSAYLDQLKGLLLDCGAVLHSNCRVQLIVQKFQDCYRLWLRPTHHHLTKQDKEGEVEREGEGELEVEEERETEREEERKNT